MKSFIIMCSLAIAAVTMQAAEKLELRQVTGGEFSAETLGGVRALADGESYAQLSGDGRQIVRHSFKDGKSTGVLFDAGTVRGAKLDKIDGYVMSPDETMMLIQTQTKSIYRRSFTAEYYIYSVRNNTIVPLSEGGPQQMPMFSPDGTMIAFVRDNNIHLVKLLYDNAESQVTKDGRTNEVINGIPDWVYEEEFGFSSAMVFTADSRQICWIRFDESKVKQYSMQMFKGLAPERDEYRCYPGFYTYKYPIAGEDNSKVSVMSYDIKSHQTRTIDVPLDADGYIPRIKATADPAKIAVYTMNRHQDDLKIYMANPLSTLCQLVLEEKADKYVKEESMAGILITDRHILVPSERDGYQHLYLYTLSGQMERKIGDGSYEISRAYGYDEATGDVFFASNERGVTQQQVYVSHKNGKTECLTPNDGFNSAVFSRNFKYFINTWSNANTPYIYTTNTSKGKTLATLIDNSALKAKLAAYDFPRVEMFTMKTSEGTELYGYMIKPKNFDAAKKYPVMMYQYGGPGNSLVVDDWGVGAARQGALLEKFFAQEGYVSVVVDNRGTGRRGADFEKCTYLRLGEKEASDQVEVALWLGRQPFVDKNRIGIWGWSYGGWNTLMAMSEGRAVFCCGVAVAPPTNWRYYDTIYTERYMRTPKENPSGYDEVNPIARAAKLSGELLICHGLADDNVHYQNTAEYSEALVQADKDFQMNIYTNRNHGIGGGNSRNHLYRQLFRFMERNMK